MRNGRGVFVKEKQRIDPYQSLDGFVDQVGLRDLCASGENAAQFLLRFAASQSSLHTTIIGTKSLDHLAENIAAVEAGPLPADVLATAIERLDAVGIVPSA